MKKTRIRLVYLILILAVGIACNKKKSEQGFSYHPSGYYYKLISFDSDSSSHANDKVSWIAASFKTQSDSIFWDSYNNLNDKYYLKNDSSKDNFFKNYISKCSALDSGCVLVKTNDFFQQQFKSAAIPFFSQNDSVVSVNFKVKRIFEKAEFVKIQHDLLRREQEKIKKYFGTQAEMEAALDPLGFYWADRSEGIGEEFPKQGDIVSISYKGEYLNGRFLEKSNSDFEFIYGTPDQLLTGLNYVIGRLKLGENAKIILPSRLAFGENGSSNGTVPPFTPLLYEIRLTNLKTAEPVSKSKKAVSKKLKQKNTK